MIESIVITVLVIWGIKGITSWPFIFYKIADNLEVRLPSWIIKPLFGCPVCMSSVWGTYFFFYFDYIGVMNLIVFVLSVAGVNYLLHEFFYPGNSEITEEEQKK